MVLVLLIIGFVEVASTALVNVAEITIEGVVGLKTALWLLTDGACEGSF